MNTLTRVGRVVPLSEFPRQVRGDFDRRDLEGLLADADPPLVLTRRDCETRGCCYCRPGGLCCDCGQPRGAV